MARAVLIEGDTTLREEIECTLDAAGHEVEAYADASQAWDALRSGAPLGLVITEIVSPAGRPHGLALAHNARLHHWGVSVVFITADRTAAGLARGEPNSVLLMKPFEMAALLAAVDEAIGGRPISTDQPSVPSEPSIP